jgi:microcystin-dependent protein
VLGNILSTAFAYVTKASPTTFNLPDTSGRTVRGVNGTYILGGTGGADSKTLAIADIPKHGHQLSNISKNTVGYTGGSGYGSVDNNPANTAIISSVSSTGTLNNTIYDGSTATATQTAVSFVNQYVGINYIIKA